MADEVIIAHPKACDYCQMYADRMMETYKVYVEVKPALYDAKTKGGPWANMCAEHMLEEGLGKLGTGLGQRLIVKKPEDSK